MNKSKYNFIPIFCLMVVIEIFLLSTFVVYASEVKNYDLLSQKRKDYFSSVSKNYENKNIKILIVPGHDDEYWGTEFKGLKEVELNRKISEMLFESLSKEPGFTVTLASDKNGYREPVYSFLSKNRNNILDFISVSKEDFTEKLKNGGIEYTSTIDHNKAPQEVAFRLYGLNMWANENKHDLVLHIHFNDYPGRYKDKTPKYNGFSIYIPEKQLNNHEVSKKFAKSIFDRLSKIRAVSNLKLEASGIIETQDLIAIGSNNTLNAGSVLIEYGYIYEPQFSDPNISHRVLEELAKQTHRGIKDVFNEKTVLADEKYVFKNDLRIDDGSRSEDVYMLQKELALKGYLPSGNRNLNNCPIAGFFGQCTHEAVVEFQKDNNLPDTGFVGPITREFLNKK